MSLFTEFVKGQENAQDQLNENFEKLDTTLKDTGWLNIAPETGYKWRTDYPVQYRIKDGWVTLRGAVEGTSGIANGIFLKLPAGSNPTYRLGFTVAAWSTLPTERATIYVNEDGNVQLITSPGNKNIWMNQISFPLG